MKSLFRPFTFIILVVFSPLVAYDQRLALQLSSGMVEERVNAAYLLGMSEDSDATELLLNQLSNETVKENKLVMIESIRKLDRKEGYLGLSSMYEREADIDVKRKLIQVLGDSGNDRYVDLIEKSLYNSEETDQRLGLFALSQINHPSSTKVLFQYLLKQSSSQIKKEWALTAIASQKRIEVVKPLIFLGMQVKESPERARIAEVLGEIGDHQAQDAIFSWYLDASDNTSKKRLVKSLKGVGSSNLVGKLYKELKHSTLPTQVELIHTMVAIDQDAAFPYLELFYQQQMKGLNPNASRMEAMTTIRLHRLLRDLLKIQEDPSESYPVKWREDPILNQLIAG